MSLYRSLRDAGVLGNNQRLRKYILPNNNRSDYPIVDDKIKTSELLGAHKIPSPKTMGVFHSISDTKFLHRTLKPLKEFVVKPAKGAAGNGIVIVEEVKWSENRKDTFLSTTRRENMRYDEFVYYLSMIMSGVFSLGGQVDKVIMQEKLRIHPFFKDISYKGIPDTRVILFRGFPIMAMVRLPTKSSGGRGNLHQGAVGCGVDLKTGVVTSAVHENRIVNRHPDNEEQILKGRTLPHWEQVLDVASRCCDLSRIEYLGVDIVIDPVSGPLVLEMNARPGLSIQIANGKGLIPPLEKVLALGENAMTREEKVQYALENF